MPKNHKAARAILATFLRAARIFRQRSKNARTTTSFTKIETRQNHRRGMRRIGRVLQHQPILVPPCDVHCLHPRRGTGSPHLSAGDDYHPVRVIPNTELARHRKCKCCRCAPGKPCCTAQDEKIKNPPGENSFRRVLWQERLLSCGGFQPPRRLMQANQKAIANLWGVFLKPVTLSLSTLPQ